MCGALRTRTQGADQKAGLKDHPPKVCNPGACPLGDRGRGTCHRPLPSLMNPLCPKKVSGSPQAFSLVTWEHCLVFMSVENAALTALFPSVSLARSVLMVWCLLFSDAEMLVASYREKHSSFPGSFHLKVIYTGWGFLQELQPDLWTKPSMWSSKLKGPPNQRTTELSHENEWWSEAEESTLPNKFQTLPCGSSSEGIITDICWIDIFKWVYSSQISLQHYQPLIWALESQGQWWISGPVSDKEPKRPRQE